MSYQLDVDLTPLRPDCHLDRVRYAELHGVRPLLPERGSVLEIGGGNGFQAAVLAAWGFHVTSIDIETQGAWTKRYFDVRAYDGRAIPTIPIDGGKVDVVFSSNVLEHIPRSDLIVLLEDTKRILTTKGFSVHILPSPAWRFWTSLAHYPWLIARLFRGPKMEAGIVLPSLSATASRRGVMGLVKRILWSSPHGVCPSSLGEIFAFREKVWRELFTAGGFEVVSCYPTGIFYTGYTLLPGLPISWRRVLAKLLGSACRVYVVRPLSQ